MYMRALLLMLAALLAKSQEEGAFPIITSFPTMQPLNDVLKEVPGAECRREVAIVLEGLRNLSYWAFQMADATAKVPSGLLRGNVRALGDMDECVAVQADVRGKYCLATVHMDSDLAPVARLLDVATAGRRHIEFRHRQADLDEGWTIQSPGLVPELSRGEWGVCVPAACSAADVEAALRGLARRLLPSTGLRLDVRVPPLACRTREGPARPLRAPHYLFAIIIGLLLLSAITGTIWDIYFEDQATGESSSYRVVLRAFSLRVGWKRLTSERREELGCIAGIRALASVYLMLTHQLVFYLQEPSINKVKLQMFSNIFFTPFVIGPTIVETFVTISGTLYSYHLADSIINRQFSYLTTVIHRFIRLSPIYFLLILYYASFLEYLGDGPNWPNLINYNVKSCRESWIWNVFYINNYVNHVNVCMTPSWFLATDMQLVIVAPLAVLPLFRWRRGRQLMVALIIFSMVLTAATVIIMRIPPIYRLHDTDRQILLYLLNGHTRTHMHLSSYLVGLSLGYILYKTKNKDIYLSKGFTTLGWILCALMVLANCVVSNYMVQPSYKYSLLDSVAYPAFSRLLWAIAVSWIIFICHSGYSGFLNKLFNCHALLIISRLSYIINLVQFVVLLHNGGRRRIPIWLDEFTWVGSFLTDYIISMLISLVLFVLVDSPVNIITRSFLHAGVPKKKGSPPEAMDNKNK